MAATTATSVLPSTIAIFLIVFFASIYFLSRQSLRSHHQLFTNGMRESEDRYVTMRINVSEEAPLMELIKFMYTNILTPETALAVLDVLKVADKFDVGSCIKHCKRLLKNIRMTPEFVLVYLDLPSTILTAEAFQQLTLTAKHFYVVHYKDMTKFQDEIYSLPLDSVEKIMASDDLRVTSEDAVYSFVIKWVRAQYPKLRVRSKIIQTRLAKLIRYPYMTDKMLKEVLTCDEFDHEFALQVVREANNFQTDVNHKQHTYIHIREKNLDHNHRFVERAYLHRPIKLFDYKQPHPRLVVYMDLKRDLCASLFPQGSFCSEAFQFVGHRFYFYTQCDIDQESSSSSHSFTLYLAIEETESVYFLFEYELAARSKPTEEFVSIFKRRYACTGATQVVYRCLFVFPWISFIEEDSEYFIDGVLHLKVELTYSHRETLK